MKGFWPILQAATGGAINFGFIFIEFSSRLSLNTVNDKGNMQIVIIGMFTILASKLISTKQSTARADGNVLHVLVRLLTELIKS